MLRRSAAIALCCALAACKGSNDSDARTALSSCFSASGRTLSARLSPAEVLTLSCSEPLLGGRAYNDSGVAATTTSLTINSATHPGHYDTASYLRASNELDMPDWYASSCSIDVAVPAWPPAPGTHITGSYDCPLVHGEYLQGTSGEGDFRASEAFDVVVE